MANTPIHPQSPTAIDTTGYFVGTQIVNTPEGAVRDFVVYRIDAPEVIARIIDGLNDAGFQSGGGSGTVTSVNGQSPDGAGNVAVDAASVGARPTGVDLLISEVAGLQAALDNSQPVGDYPESTSPFENDRPVYTDQSTPPRLETRVPLPAGSSTSQIVQPINSTSIATDQNQKQSALYIDVPISSGQATIGPESGFNPVLRVNGADVQLMAASFNHIEPGMSVILTITPETANATTFEETSPQTTMETDGSSAPYNVVGKAYEILLHKNPNGRPMRSFIREYDL